MVTLTQSPASHTPIPVQNWLTNYKTYVTKSEFNRIGWAATVIAIQGCILSPALLLVMSYYGGGDWQFLVSMLSFLLVLMPVLAAQPVKYIFPAFAISFVLHLLMMAIDLL